MTAAAPLTLSADVADALAEGRPVVALESTIISHGLPRPDNLRIAREIEEAVRDAGAVPATIAVVAGGVRIGLDDAALEAVATRDDVVKVSVRDVATVAALGGYGATTVASTSHLAARAGIKVFATGGLGGVHREARTSWDESADLTTLSTTGITVVCAGVKSILDVPATLERLETLNVGLLGYRTSTFPGFYLTDSGSPLDWSVADEGEAARAILAIPGLGLGDSGLVIANPLPETEQLDRALHDRALEAGLEELERRGVKGKEVTPFLLDRFAAETKGESLRVNRRIILNNARVAARVARALSGLAAGRP